MKTTTNKFDKEITATIDGEEFTGTYGELVREFADETTSPNGVAPRFHIKESEYHVYAIDGLSWDSRDYSSWQDAECEATEYAEEENLDVLEIKEELKTEYVLWSWGTNGNNPYLVLAYDSEEDANEALLETWENDMNKQDQRVLEIN